MSLSANTPGILTAFIILVSQLVQISPTHAAENACIVDIAKGLQSISDLGTKLRIRTTDRFPRGTSRPPLGIWNLNFSRHIQGVARLPGTNTIVMTGNASGGAYLYIGAMESLPAQGPWKSNYDCQKKTGCLTPEGDTFEQIIHLGKEFPHPGGLQAVENFVTFGVDHGAGRPSFIRFIDLANPRAPRELSHLTVSRKIRAETVGLARLAHESRRYALVVGANTTGTLTFYVSDGDDLSNPTTRFNEIGEWKKGDYGVKLPNYQAIQLLSQCDGKLFLLGSYKTDRILLGSDYVDAYSVDLLPDSRSPRLTLVHRQHFRCANCNFGAGAGVYVDPVTNALSYYATDYWPLNPTRRDSVIRFEEFPPSLK